jgi:hypothetical protein
MRLKNTPPERLLLSDRRFVPDQRDRLLRATNG